ncbi:hypothetical protein VTK73DRAFT_2978 [Phialemonium thermophilum]|uniref:J domain-containing protein n=1 Tax=Phialemonium thermophilum TaxID=223376 RepID=A0ABR3Y281_9PEZI
MSDAERSKEQVLHEDASYVPAHTDADSDGFNTSRPSATKFRFKSENSSSRHGRSQGKDELETSSATGRDHHHSRRHRHRHSRPPGGANDERHRHRRRERRSHESSRKLRGSDDGAPHDPFAVPPLSPNTAFRESLFDAMADDEGAAYWEGVYGQPIHVYERPATRATSETAGADSLNQMTDEEYAAYVRQKMWEKTHAGLLEERARQERAREAQKREAAEAQRVAAEVERSLRRGEERRRRRTWARRWEEYAAAWERWSQEADSGAKLAANLPWPTLSGGRDEITSSQDGGNSGSTGVRDFFVLGLGLKELGEKEFAARLKEERIKWHPDKVQQRLGGQVDNDMMRDVTAVFQIIDRLWNDTRSKVTM